MLFSCLSLDHRMLVWIQRLNQLDGSYSATKNIVSLISQVLRLLFLVVLMCCAHYNSLTVRGCKVFPHWDVGLPRFMAMAHGVAEGSFLGVIPPCFNCSPGSRSCKFQQLGCGDQLWLASAHGWRPSPELQKPGGVQAESCLGQSSRRALGTGFDEQHVFHMWCLEPEQPMV